MPPLTAQSVTAEKRERKKALRVFKNLMITHRSQLNRIIRRCEVSLDNKNLIAPQTVYDLIMLWNNYVDTYGSQAFNRLMDLMNVFED